MSASTLTDGAVDRRPAPARLWVVGGLGLAWNAYGVAQFAGSALRSEAELVDGGMTAVQAAFYAALPGWLTLVFAIGVFGGLLGSGLLLLRSRFAVPVFTVSLAGYVLLYVGDAALGVFAMFGIGQAAILTFVVCVAGALLAAARTLHRRGAIA
jgi:hypothetical protein